MINPNNYNCTTCSTPKSTLSGCGNFLKSDTCIPMQECPRRNIYEECETCQFFYPLDDPNYGIHANFTIPLKDDPESGIMLDRSIPFGLIDFRDLGRSGECSDDCAKRGRVLNYYAEDGKTLMYQLESKGWHNYYWRCIDGQNELICKQDRRIPVEALSPYDLCEYNPYTCTGGQGCDNTTPELVCELNNPCPFRTISLVCDDGKCSVGWLDNPIAVIDTDSVDMTLEPKPGGGIQIKSDVRICPESANILDIKPCGLDLVLCEDSGLEKRECGLAIKICRINEQGLADDDDQVLTTSECGLRFNIEDTNSINLSKTLNGLTADLRFADTNTVNHEVNASGLVSNVKYQNTNSIVFSEDSSGLKADVRVCPSGGLAVTECGLTIDLSESCSGNLAEVRNDGLCVSLVTDQRFFAGNGTQASPLTWLSPTVPVGATANNLNLQTVDAPNFASALLTLASVTPPYTAPAGFKWIITLNSTVTIACEEDPLSLDQETVAGHLILVNGSANHIGGAYHAVGNLVASPGYPKRITGSTGGTYNINQSGSTSIQMSIDANNSGNGSFNPTLSYISPSFSGFLHLVKA